MIVLAFLRSPLGRSLAIGLAGFLLVAAVVGVLYSAGKKAGIAADAKRSAPIIARLNSDLGQCRTNLENSGNALQVQTDAVEALQRESEARLAQIRKLTIQSKKATLKAEQASAYIRAHPPAGPDVCTRMLNGYETFREAIAK